jgi:DNA-binding transcriptional ArsR family regulator
LSARRDDRVWKALADPTRRRILDLLAARPRTTGELADAFGRLSRFAIMKHLRVLQKAGLLIVTREARKRWNALNPVPLQEVLRRWIGKNEQTWANALLNIRDAAEVAESQPKDQPQKGATS